MSKKELGSELKGIKFEEALKKLEKIVEKLEGGDVPLDESITLYEDGIGLFKHCSSKLEEAKKKVEILTKKGSDSKMEPRPFQEDKESSDDQEEIPF